MIALLWTLTGLFLLILVAGLGLSFYMTRRHKLGEVHTPAEYDLDYEEVEIVASDGLLLRGWWIPAAGSPRAVVILHGHGGSMDYDVYRARYLHDAGFNVLLFDFRAHGRSQGRVASFGYLERRDVAGAVSFLKERGILRIGVLGFSYGGIASVLSAPVCPEIDALVVDGCPARMRVAIAAHTAEIGLPRWLCPFTAWLAISMASLRLGVNLFGYEPQRWVAKIAPRPILFIHGDQDQYCPDFDAFFSAAGQPKEVWRAAEAGHTTLSREMPEEHQRRVLTFFQQYL